MPTKAISKLAVDTAKRDAKNAAARAKRAAAAAAKVQAERDASPTVQVSVKGDPSQWQTVAKERLVPVNNGFGSWDGFLFGEFTEIGQRCLNMADHLSLQDALVRGNADFTVGKVHAAYQVPDGPLLQVPEHYVTFREDTGEALGVVGAGYTVLQNAVALAPAMAIDVANDGRGNFIGLAAIDNGRQVAALYALAPLKFGADEEVLPVIMTWTSHDGSRASEYVFCPIRIACFNGNMWHVAGTSSTFRVKHTVNAELKLQRASEALAEGNAFFTAWADEAKALVASRIDLAQADAYLAAIVEDKQKGQKADTIRQTVIDNVRAIYLHAPDLQNVQGTKYGLLQAISAYVDHDHRTRVVDKDDGTTVEQRDAQLRFLRATSMHPLKSAAHAVLIAA